MAYIIKKITVVLTIFSVDDTEFMQNHYLSCDLKVPILIWGMVMLILCKKEGKNAIHMNAAPKEPLSVE